MVREEMVDRLAVVVHDDGPGLAEAAADQAASLIVSSVRARGTAHAMFATGNSQIAFVDTLMGRTDVPWRDVVVFHMDEYVGIGADHPASFRRWIAERIGDRAPVAAAHYIDGLAPPGVECERYAALLQAHPLDLCCLGVGENGHLAFNDPHVARFDDPVDVKVVDMDLACRAQQVGEGHFPDVDAVPRQAITVTVPAPLRARSVIAVVPEQRKAPAVRAALRGPISTVCPASASRTAGDATLYLDPESASLLDG